MGKELVTFNGGILTNECPDEILRAYFEFILKLYKTGDEFPASLDDVWGLVYSEKSKAVRALRKSVFVEGADYYLAQNGEVIKSTEIRNGVSVEYRLSVKCLEFFIARKVRRIFDVYREVFKRVATGELEPKEQQKPMTAVQMFALQAQINLDNENRLNAIEKKLENLEQEREENKQQLLALPMSTNQVPEMTMRKNILALVNSYCSSTNTAQQDVWHKIYSDLYYRYGKSINNYKKVKNSESKLDVAERNGLLPYIMDIVSEMVSKIAQSA